MAMTIHDVDRVAALAKLEFSQAEKERLLAELNAMLAYIDALDDVDTSGVEPLVCVGDADAGLRADEARPSPPREPMLANAPDRAGSFFRVPSVIKGTPS